MKFITLQTPSLPLPAIEAFAAERYGLSGTFTPLASERDLNFRVTPAQGASVVLKISNLHEPREMVELEVAALEHIARAGWRPPPCPCPLLA
jgi:Ser/Thr protein kinase RdoA (MazF antagonist)